MVHTERLDFPGQYISSTDDRKKRKNSGRSALKAVAAVFTFAWISRLVERLLQKKMRALGLNLTYEAFYLNPFRLGISFKNLRLSSAQKEGVFSLRLEKAEVGIRLKDILRGRWQYISKILLHNGRISIHELDALKAMFPEKKESTHGLELAKKERAQKGWKIGEIDLKSIGVYVDGETGGHLHLDVLQGSWHAKHSDFGLRHGILDQPLRFTVSDIHMATLFKWHGITTDLIAYDMERKEIRCEGIHLFPKVEYGYLDQHEPHIALHADLTVPEIVVSGLEWSHTDLLHWRAEKILVSKPHFNAFQNKEKPLRPGIRAMPTHWTNHFAFKFMVDTIQLTDGAMAYTFSPPGAEEPGQLNIHQLDLLWKGYGNDITRPKAFTAEATMCWMEDAWMSAKVTFPYDDATSGFELSGNLEAAGFEQFNPVTVVAQGLQFLSGHYNSFRFSFDGNEEHIDGKIWIDFEDVKVGFPELKQRFVGRVKAFVANAFVIRHSTHGEEREVEASAQRNPQQSVFALWMKGLMSCLMNALKK